jgi:hypothetical protein
MRPERRFPNRAGRPVRGRRCRRARTTRKSDSAARSAAPHAASIRSTAAGRPRRRCCPARSSVATRPGRRPPACPIAPAACRQDRPTTVRRRPRPLHRPGRCNHLGKHPDARMRAAAQGQQTGCGVQQQDKYGCAKRRHCCPGTVGTAKLATPMLPRRSLTRISDPGGWVACRAQDSSRQCK